MGKQLSISKRVWLAALLASVAVTTVMGCTSSTNTGLTGVDRKQLLLVDSATVNNLSLQSYGQDLSAAKAKGLLNPDAKQLARLQTIAKRLTAHVATFRPDAQAWKWEVNITKSNELNAYCAPGGKIMFYTGIIERLALTDDELAAIMGHEITHALREHGRERMSRKMAKDLGMGVLAASVGMTQGQAQAVQIAAQLGLELPFGRGQETEADLLGLELMAMAGYNPNAAVTLWQKMQKASQGEPLKFLSTHPSSGDRIAKLQGNISKVMPLYLKATAKAVKK